MLGFLLPEAGPAPLMVELVVSSRRVHFTPYFDGASVMIIKHFFKVEIN